ncbi:MAG: hypothetical protein WB421_13450, partial [Terriglobales bacterium]
MAGSNAAILQSYQVSTNYTPMFGQPSWRTNPITTPGFADYSNPTLFTPIMNGENVPCNFQLQDLQNNAGQFITSIDLEFDLQLSWAPSNNWQAVYDNGHMSTLIGQTSENPATYSSTWNDVYTTLDRWWGTRALKSWEIRQGTYSCQNSTDTNMDYERLCMGLFHNTEETRVFLKEQNQFEGPSYFTACTPTSHRVLPFKADLGFSEYTAYTKIDNRMFIPNATQNTTG